jgi:hypothetical protein
VDTVQKDLTAEVRRLFGGEYSELLDRPIKGGSFEQQVHGWQLAIDARGDQLSWPGGSGA